MRNEDIKTEGDIIHIYDLAVPRDVDKELSEKRE